MTFTFKRVNWGVMWSFSHRGKYFCR